MKRLIDASYTIALSLAWPTALVAEQYVPVPQPIWADYANPTDRYPHNIMGTLAAHTDLIVGLEPCQQCSEEPDSLTVRLPAQLVFEDFAPRLFDLNGDGRNEIVVVESDQIKGARLAVWDVILEEGNPSLVRGATTDFIGTRFRWLSPIGAADFDGDGAIELAYVETPHLNKILHIVRRDGSHLTRIGSVQGVTNHAIGQEDVQSRIEVCAGVPSIFALDGSGEMMLSIQMSDGTLQVTELSPTENRHRLDDGTLCNE